MTDPRNVAHDKRVHQEKKHHDAAAGLPPHAAPRPGMKQHVHSDVTGHAPDADEAVDKTESGIEP